MDESGAQPTRDLAQAARQKLSTLNEREHALLVWLTHGHSLVEIAHKLNTSFEAAARLKALTMRKLGVQYTAEAVRIGILAGIDHDVSVEE